MAEEKTDIWWNDILNFVPETEQEQSDSQIILDLITKNPHKILYRESRTAHMTVSGFIVNEARDKVLLLHHNIYRTWTWSGGHADGESDLLAVALREATEETGVTQIYALSKKIVSLDILPVFGHVKKGKYVSAHLHLNASYALTASESCELRIKEDENSGVRWFPFEEIEKVSGEPEICRIYRKILNRIL